jgi:hypothetical protein
MRKEKKKEKRKALPVRPGGLEARFALACSLLSLFALGRAELSRRFPVSSCARVGWPRDQPRPRVPLSSVADGWDPAVSRDLLPHVVTKPECVIFIESNPCYPGFLSKPRRLSSI